MPLEYPALCFADRLAISIRNLLPDKKNEETFDSKLRLSARGAVEQMPCEPGWTIFLVKVQERLNRRDIHLVAACRPKLVFEPGVEAVVDGQKIADVVPHFGERRVKERFHSRPGVELGIDKDAHHCLDLR